VKECGLSAGTPHIDGGSLCFITVGIDPEVADTTKQVALQENIQFLNAFPDYSQNLLNAQLVPLLHGAEALVCLIDFDKSQELAAQAAITIQPMVNGRTALIALSGDENPDLILNAMRAGCSEYLTKPLQADQLSSSLRKLRARWLSSPVRPTQPAGRVLAFLSVRGGAGATTIAIHLATFLAKRHAQKTLILDLHPHLGHVAMLLGIDSRSYNFHELLRNVLRLDPTLLSSYVVHHSSGVDVLLSPDSLNETDLISSDALGQAMRFLAAVYNYVLIDCASGLDELNQTTIGCCNEVFLVTTPEVPALRDLARYVDRLLECYVPPEKLKVVLNQHDSRRTVTVDQIEKAIRHPVSITLPTSSAELIQAVETGEPISPEKRSEFASQIKNWASSLVPGKVAQTETKRRFAFWN
jgi:pilus assembly protein CpaE